MAKLKSKVEEKPEVVEETPSYMNEEEKEAIQTQDSSNLEEGASTKRMQLVTSLVSLKFGLDNTYKVAKFDDKGKVVAITLDGDDFAINVTIKDTFKHNLFV